MDWEAGITGWARPVRQRWPRAATHKNDAVATDKEHLDLAALDLDVSRAFGESRAGVQLSTASMRRFAAAQPRPPLGTHPGSKRRAVLLDIHNVYCLLDGGEDDIHVRVVRLWMSARRIQGSS